MAISDGGRAAHGNQPTDATTAQLNARWRRQIRAVRWGIWASIRARGAITPDDLAEEFPSALARRAEPAVPHDRHGHIIRAENAIESRPRSTSTTSSDPPRGTGSGLDAWSHDLLDTIDDSVTDTVVLFPRAGDPRGLHDPDVIDQARIAGAAIRIRTAPIDAHAAASPRILIPGAAHEDLHMWSIRSDDVDAPVPPVLPALADADRQLRRAILEAEAVISELGLRAGPSEARTMWENATHALASASLPRSYSGNRRSVLLRAAPMMWLCDLALADDSVTITRSDRQARSEILLELDRAARDALEAATAWTRSDERAAMGTPTPGAPGSR